MSKVHEDIIENLKKQLSQLRRELEIADEENDSLRKQVGHLKNENDTLRNAAKPTPPPEVERKAASEDLVDTKGLPEYVRRTIKEVAAAFGMPPMFVKGFLSPSDQESLKPGKIQMVNGSVVKVTNARGKEPSIVAALRAIGKPASVHEVAAYMGISTVSVYLGAKRYSNIIAASDDRPRLFSLRKS